MCAGAWQGAAQPAQPFRRHRRVGLGGLTEEIPQDSARTRPDGVRGPEESIPGDLLTLLEFSRKGDFFRQLGQCLSRQT